MRMIQHYEAFAVEIISLALKTACLPDVGQDSVQLYKQCTEMFIYQ